MSKQVRRKIDKLINSRHENVQKWLARIPEHFPALISISTISQLRRLLHSSDPEIASFADNLISRGSFREFFPEYLRT